MKRNGVRPPRRGRRVPRTTDGRHDLGIAPNLPARDFKIGTPDTVWLADIGDVPADEGRPHLAAVKDPATMEIVGWSTSDRLKASLAVDATGMALRNRRPTPGPIRHSDRGVRYACGDCRWPPKAHGALASTSGKGDCLDDAPMESVFGSSKTELVHRTGFASRRDATATLFECIAIFHDRRRRLSSIGRRTPEQARTDTTRAMAAW